MIDHYATGKPASAPSRAATFGIFGWSVATLIWVGIGRIAEFIPVIRGLPLGKIAAALAFVAYWAAGPRRAAVIPLLSTAFGRTAALLAAIGLLSMSFSIWKSATLHEIGECVATGSGFWLVYQAASNWRNIRLLLGHIAAAAGALALTAAIQYTGGRAEVHSSYDTNDLAYVLDAVLPIAYAGAMTSKAAARMLWMLLCGAFVIAVLLTGSRGGAVGFAAVVVGLVFSSKTRPLRSGAARGSRRNAVIAMSCLIALCAMSWPLLPPQTRERMETFAHLDADYNMKGGHDSRLDIWSRSMSSLVMRPIGFGLGTFPAVDGMTGGQYRAPHNSEVQIAVELGFAGLFLYLRMYLLSWRALGRMTAPAGSGPAVDERKRIFAANLRISLVGNFVAGFFLSQAYSNLIWILFALIAAMAADDDRAAHPVQG